MRWTGWRTGRRLGGALLLVAALSAPASAAVKLSFYSRDFGVYFPHAFIEVTGATDADPTHPVDHNYGFTAQGLSPAILLGPVRGEIITMGPGYVHGSQRHFSMRISDAQYAALIALVAQWRALPGRSYDLHHRNCVSFVKAVAELVQLKADHTDRLMMRPRSFLDEIGFENPGALDLSDAYVPKLDPAEAKRQGHQSLEQAAQN